MFNRLWCSCSCETLCEPETFNRDPWIWVGAENDPGIDLAAWSSGGKVIDVEGQIVANPGTFWTPSDNLFFVEWPDSYDPHLNFYKWRWIVAAVIEYDNADPPTSSLGAHLYVEWEIPTLADRTVGDCVKEEIYRLGYNDGTSDTQLNERFRTSFETGDHHICLVNTPANGSRIRFIDNTFGYRLSNINDGEDGDYYELLNAGTVEVNNTGDEITVAADEFLLLSDASATGDAASWSVVKKDNVTMVRRLTYTVGNSPTEFSIQADISQSQVDTLGGSIALKLEDIAS